MTTLRVCFARRTPFRGRTWASGAEADISINELAEVRGSVTIVDTCHVSPYSDAAPDAERAPPIARDLGRVGVRDRLQRLVHGPWRPFWQR